MADLEKICLELDAVTNDFFDKLDEIYKHQYELDKLLQDGYSNMAKTRYIMGARSVGALQYNVDDLESASQHVRVIPGDGKECCPIFEVIQRSSDTSKTRKQKSDSELRKRVIPKSGTEGLRQGIEEVKLNGDQQKTESPGDKKEQTIEALEKPRKDPIRWFGILVPQTLRQSQSRFCRATELCCTLATLKGELLEVKQRFEKLKRDKREILATTATSAGDVASSDVATTPADGDVMKSGNGDWVHCDDTSSPTENLSES